MNPMKSPCSIIAIDSGRISPEDPEPHSSSLSKDKKKVANQHTRRAFVAAFFGLGYSTTQAARMTGHSRADGEEILRRIGYPEWLRRNGRAA